MKANKTPIEIARNLYPLVFRTDFSQPGFALLNLGADYGSEAQRQLMVELKRQFDQLEVQYRGRRLIYQSMGRFDQQVTTKPHRDGGPNESVLMLGYEPTLVQSRVAMSDYSKCAHALGITPAEFLDRFNPMFVSGQNKLADYTTETDDFDNTSFQILIINNSTNPIGDGRLLGVLHTAEIVDPNPDLVRVVNSTMIASVSLSADDDISESEQADFVTTTVVRKAVYG
ncbi:hypothetical protein [Fuerstiella marisgermanici]|uniref:Uncharacterized protein n=1 Tax=Fuerstiella marisgermanici TaxID=1891926 RepID=A0A1P8WH09_9PLAN|nr:hypothetical protein [Fuerstiella marisgermanici]APZ93366.1 hypothetical protein Fuma_02983 [Fuerstiella marisgermanici]